MTLNEQIVYDCIVTSFRLRRCAPTDREIKAALNTRSNSAVGFYVTKLIQKGLIERIDYGRHRGIRLVGCCGTCGQKLEKPPTIPPPGSRSDWEGNANS